MSYGGAYVDLSEEELFLALDRVVEKSERVFETDRGILSDYTEIWVASEEQEYIDPLSPAPEGCIKSGPPAPGVDRVYFPRLPLAEYTSPKNDNLLCAPGKLEALLNSMHFASRRARRNILRNRRAVVKISDEGRKERVVIVPRHIVKREVGKPLRYDDTDPQTQAMLDEFDRDVIDRKYKRTYLLDDVLEDPTIAAQYGASVRAVRSLRKNLLGNERTAAALLQDLMNMRQQHTCVEIRLDHPSRDRIRAEATIRDFAKDYRQQGASMDSAVMDETLYMYGWEGVTDWHVRGPLQHAETIARLFWIANVEGPYRVAMLFSMEMVSLGIHVADGLMGTWDMGMTYHAAKEELTCENLGATESVEVVKEEVRDSVAGVLPVTNNDGLQLGSALRLDADCILVNSHLLDAAGEAFAGGESLIPEVQLSSDLVLARCNDRGRCGCREVLPKFRSPVENERVVISYCRDRVVCTSEVLTVISVGDSTFDMGWRESISFGFSGGTVVALEDGGLLGLHSGSRMGHLVACSIGVPRIRDRISEALIDSSSSSASDKSSYARSVVLSLKSTGRATIYDALAASISEISSVESGPRFSVSDGDKWVVPAFEREDYDKGKPGWDDYVYRQVTGVSSDPGVFPVAIRGPHLYEQVHVMWKLGSEVQISRWLRIEDVLSDHFLVSSFPGSDNLCGAVVFARDGAALGVVFGRVSCTNVGVALIVYPYPSRVPAKAVKRSVADLARAFPQVNFKDWPPGVIEEVVTHSSRGYYDSGRPFNAGQRPLANVGDDVAKTRLYVKLREAGVPYAEWSVEWQKRQSNAAMSRMCWQVGLASMLVTDEGTMFPKESKAYADMLEAFVGAISIYSFNALDSVLSTCGLI